MTRDELLYALENAWLCRISREWCNFNIEETIDSSDFNKGFRTRDGERLSLKVIRDILEDLGAFDE